MKKIYFSFTFLLFQLISGQNEADIDNSFLTGSGFNGPIFTTIIQSDEKIILGGNFTQYNGTNVSNLIRVNSNGTLDSTFNFENPFIGNDSESYYIDTIRSITLLSDGKLIVAGNGSVSGNFGRTIIFKLNSNGEIDNSFIVGNGSGSTSGYITTTNQTDGKILIGGRFTSFNGVAKNNLVRLNSNGSIDNSFTTPPNLYVSPTLDGVVTIAIQTDGKILVGGDLWINNSGTLSSKFLIRLNSSGSLDSTFNTGNGFDGSVYSIKLNNNKIIVGGFFSSYKDQPTQQSIIRLDMNGNKDTSFNYGTGFNSAVSSILIQSTGEILIGGHFQTYNSVQSNRLIRLNSDGTIDSTFDVENGFSGGSSSWNYTIWSINSQSDGKIIIGGNFIDYKDVEKNYIVRLLGDAYLSNENFNTENNIKLYPNPTSNILTITQENIKNVTITDLTGKTVLKQSTNNKISVSSLQKGIYLVTIEALDGKLETQKIIKE